MWDTPYAQLLTIVDVLTAHEKIQNDPRWFQYVYIDSTLVKNVEGNKIEGKILLTGKKQQLNSVIFHGHPDAHTKRKVETAEGDDPSAARAERVEVWNASTLHWAIRKL